jgi:superkiller protein 3
LGEAYAKASRHFAAFKTLHRAQELQPDDWVSTHLIGDVHRQTQRFQEAIAYFQSVFQVQPNELVGLTSLVQAYIDLGLSELSTGFSSRAQDSFVAALQITFHFLNTNSTFHTFAWKIIADSVTSYAYLLSRMKPPSELFFHKRVVSSFRILGIDSREALTHQSNSQTIGLTGQMP